MIEPIMYFGIGFLAASLLGLVFVPLVHTRAVRLTIRRLEAATPVSMMEIQAEKDQLRAEFAMSTRRLEMSVEQLKAKTTSQLGELGKKAVAINKLKLEVGEKTATILELEAREKALRDQLRATEQEYSVKTNRVQQIEHMLADKEAELGRLTGALGERTMVSDSQRVEIVALTTKVEALRTQIAGLQKEIQQTEDRLRTESAAADKVSRELTVERGKVENFGARIGLLEHQLVAQKTEAEILGRRAHDLEDRLNEQGRMLAEREYELRTVRSELEQTHGTKAERAQADQELERSRQECIALQRELAAVKRGTESAWTSERVENALLRERINDIAADVARLTLALEGPDSPIEMILAGEATGVRSAANGVEGSPATAEQRDMAQGNLVDRIRALQTRASRIAPAP